jgi:hypothetical protein
MKPANFAPIYCALYPELAEIARNHGYALAVHGSMARDFDLIAIPWADQCSHPDNVIDDITSRFAIKKTTPMTNHKHGRMCYTLSVSFGKCFLDLSFMPLVPSN